MLFQRKQGQGRPEGLFLLIVKVDNPHILGDQELTHLIDLPFQFLLIRRGDCDQKIQIVEILVIGQAFLQEVSASDGTVNIIEIRIGIAGILNSGSVDSQLPSNSLYHLFLVLPGQEHIHIDPVTCVDYKAQPACRNLCTVAIGGNQQIGIVKTVDADVVPMGKIDRPRSDKLIDRDIINIHALDQILSGNLLDP